jgi:hypothetical protein
MRMSEHRVSDRAADAPRLESTLLEPTRDGEDGLRWTQKGHGESGDELVWWDGLAGR